ncbi:MULTISPECIES: hypothetical protein [Rhodococcus]|jgi:hypothetical protein|uniref:Uncharacterized protein n=3 Tax=Rhodococcus erythropolis TaxID=1833 RepID=A0A401N150_RHOER|nr:MULTISPECIES: hypothetical protein [Rhodococcus]ERB54952.1 hypothetical protein N806_27900 [Rhodococcus sp. P27]ULD44733.1 hypothetical protein JKI97_16400 [Rhodococcus qingshengii]EQM34270.1 hypothetical protein N601_07895 [Rhodococcus erythropolis DN1]MBH5145772.1 hypothetical protein [Rhodococcus erythropolis]MDO1489583.1 hypothetical protein [Rhodococcus erythropolis]
MMAENTTVETEIADEEIETVAEETARMAQHVVAAYAEDADECRMLLSMLGISPAAKLD